MGDSAIAGGHVRDDKIYNYACMIKLKFLIKFSCSVHENVPNPLTGLSPPAVGELSSTSNSFKHSKRFPKLCVSGAAIVEDHEIKRGVALGEPCRKDRSSKVYPRGHQRRTERFSCRDNSEKRTNTRGPALEGGRLTRSRGSICVTGT